MSPELTEALVRAKHLAKRLNETLTFASLQSIEEDDGIGSDLCNRLDRAHAAAYKLLHYLQETQP